jgi:hypothetical protein
MGMGMIGRALAAGVAGATGSLANSYGMQAKMQMEEEKQKRMAEFASQMRRDDTKWAADFKDERDAAKISEFKTREDELYNGAAEAGPVDEATQKRLRRQAGFEAGLINMKDLETAEYQEGRNKIADERYANEAEFRQKRFDREDQRMSAAEGKAAKAERDQEELKSAIANFNRMKSMPGITQEMLEIANTKVLRAGGKSMLAGPEMAKIKETNEGGAITVTKEYQKPISRGNSDPLGLRR